MPNPSLLIVPARFKTGRLYSQIPSNTDNRGDFNVTRATAATRVNSAGLIESVASGIPRLDYFASGGVVGCPALLVEPAGTNFARNVQFMTQADTPAVSGGMTITTGSTDFLAPDGTSGSITKYVGGAASGISQFAYDANGYTVTAAGQHTFSLFVKAGSSNPANFIRLRFAGWTSATGTSDTYFSLASGTVLTTGASIRNYGNGWYQLISAPYTIASGDLQGLVTVSLAEDVGDVTWPASGALNLTAYTWGAQLETGSIATSYIPTTTGQVTRNADVVSVSGAVSGCIGQTEGTIYAEVNITNIVGKNIVSCDSGDTTNRVAFFLGTSPNRLEAVISSGSTTVVVSGAITTGTHKMAYSYSSGSVQVYLDGAFLASGTPTVFPTVSLNNLSIGSRILSGTYGSFFNDRIRAVALYTTRLTNAQLAALTTL